MSRKLALNGQKFGRLLAIEMSGSNKHGKAIWRCICDCGNERTVIASALINLSTKSCGCIQKEITAQRNKDNAIHGKSRTIEHHSYQGMMNRCYNENQINYSNYGGRGIEVCDRWLNNFENFLEDMGKKPSNNYSIERVNNSLGYSKENCKWATRSEQNANRRKKSTGDNKYIGINRTLSDKCSANISFNGIRKSLGSFKTDIEAALMRDIHILSNRLPHTLNFTYKEIKCQR